MYEITYLFRYLYKRYEDDNIEFLSREEIKNLPMWLRKIHDFMSVTFVVDRGVTHEIVRHRISNFINLYKSSNSLNNLINDQNSDLKEIAKKNNQTIVMVTHDVRLAEFADKIVNIHDGKIVSVEEK